ncbi:hypothetical protein [Aureicoccus marinus]|uniref:TonB-dependent receptor-like beta-barrel domain-containing protein n=1 Tax=Aureicoccus marinus TaxID=754435 RepID=A0A2S7T3P0_9FLAO|nr:hypothetical protein [Aureicoccus marinus]PQJ14513.1 hypothetical protein BST99_00970 [Aureicoccus marinus]
MRTVISIVFLLILGPALAQDKPLNTQTVTVTRSYAPSIAPASKILSEPGLSDSLFLKKRPVQWSRFTAPVASTFSPAKGKAEKVQPEPPEKLYNTAVSLAAGNFTNIEAEAFTRQPLGTGRNSYALGLEHRSAQGDILDNPLPTSFSQTALEGGLHFKGKENTGHLLMEIQRDIYHWYGFDRDLFGPESFPESGVQQRYFTGALNGQYTDDKVAVDGGFRWFTDETGSDESRLQFGSRFDVEIEETRVSFLPSIDWVQGQQSVTSLREVAAASPDRYSQAQAEIAVYWSIKKRSGISKSVVPLCTMSMLWIGIRASRFIPELKHVIPCKKKNTTSLGRPPVVSNRTAMPRQWPQIPLLPLVWIFAPTNSNTW